MGNSMNFLNSCLPQQPPINPASNTSPQGNQPTSKWDDMDDDFEEEDENNNSSKSPPSPNKPSSPLSHPPTNASGSLALNVKQKATSSSSTVNTTIAPSEIAKPTNRLPPVQQPTQGSDDFFSDMTPAYRAPKKAEVVEKNASSRLRFDNTAEMDEEGGWENDSLDGLEGSDKERTREKRERKKINQRSKEPKPNKLVAVKLGSTKSSNFEEED